MPGISGLELIQSAQEQGLCENFCIISGYSEFEYARTAIQLGVEDYLLKPVDKDKLKELLKKVSEKAYYRDVSRRRERENLLADCLFGRLDTPNLSLNREAPVLLVVAEGLFSGSRPVSRQDVQHCLGQGLAEDMLHIYHLPVFVLFSRPEKEQTLVEALLETCLGMFIGTASGSPANSSELRKLYERALCAALVTHCFLEKHYLNGEELPILLPGRIGDISGILAPQLGITATEGQLLFYHLCWHSLAANSPAFEHREVSNSYATQILEMVERQYAEELTLNGVAKTIGLNPEYAGKLFRSEMGMSFSEYLNRCRIAHILECMIHDPSLSFEQLAPCMGFPDLRNFYRVFKRIMQTTPGKFKESICPPKEKEN